MSVLRMTRAVGVLTASCLCFAFLPGCSADGTATRNARDRIDGVVSQLRLTSLGHVLLDKIGGKANRPTQAPFRRLVVEVPDGDAAIKSLAADAQAAGFHLVGACLPNICMLERNTAPGYVSLAMAAFRGGSSIDGVAVPEDSEAVRILVQT